MGERRQDREGDAACSGARGGSLNFACFSGAHWSVSRNEEACPVSGALPRMIGDPFPLWQHARSGEDPCSSRGAQRGGKRQERRTGMRRAMKRLAPSAGRTTGIPPRRIEDPLPTWPHGRLDIACFSEKVADLDQRLTTVEDHNGMLPVHDAELQTLREKITDLEDWSHRDNVQFFCISEKREGTDIKIFHQSLLPELTRLTFSPPLEFQRIHRVSPPRYISSGGPARSLRVSFGMSRLSSPPEGAVPGPIPAGRSEGQSSSGFFQDHE
ncbi:hypothetical protein NDU88_003607 [Pleurodeles waltl]|uniref:Uncharacterized protein n=1 Tax=Pleurodeles waltl TaxID=8319 RepID=A0AAV7T5Y4_PLEWA|nr:hypothetical protein NDU88_003607 [Pleurodeles waltl]